MSDISANNGAPISGPGSGSLSLSDRVRSLRLPDRPSSYGAPAGKLTWFLLVLVVLLGAALGYNVYATQNALRDIEQLKMNPLAGLNLEGEGLPQNFPVPGKGPVEPRPQQPTGPIALESKGFILPVQMIQVSPQVGGIVTELNFEEGLEVKAGTILAKIEDIEYKAEKDRVAAMVESAKSRLDELQEYRPKEVQQAKAELDDARALREQFFKDFKRSQELRFANALAAREYEEAESKIKSQEFRVLRFQLAYDLLKGRGPRDAQIDAAKAAIRQAEAELAKVQWKWEKTIVKAPIDGVILSKKAEKGNQVNPAAFSNGLSASLCEMADLFNLEVELKIAERDIAKVFRGQKCQIQAEAYKGRYYKGEVSRIMPAADRSNGAVPVRVRILEFYPDEMQGQFLRPDMGALVTFMNDKK